MTVRRPVTILGGLPAIAEVSYSYDSYTMESDAEVLDLLWCKRDGSAGKSIPKGMFERALTYGNDHQGCNIIEQVNGQLDYEAWRERELEAGRDPDAISQFEIAP